MPLDRGVCSGLSPSRSELGPKKSSAGGLKETGRGVMGVEERGAGTSGTLLKAVDLGKKFAVGRENIWIFRGLNFSLKSGEMVCLWGPSGSGKTTLLTLLAGLEKPSEGVVTLMGEPLKGLSEPQMARLRMRAIGFVFQFFYLMPGLNVLENIALPLVAAGEAREALSEAKRLAVRLGLGDRLGHFPRQLSGGEQQRVALARALIMDPPIVMADEPTGNLDAASAGVVMSRLRQLADDGRAVLIASHNPRVVEMSDRVFDLATSSTSAREG
jgi:ABC-type lipoprotein export system ATPase subunit